MASDDPGTTIQLGDHSKLLKVPVAQVYILQVASIGVCCFPQKNWTLLRSLSFLGPNSHNLVHIKDKYGRCQWA